MKSLYIFLRTFNDFEHFSCFFAVHFIQLQKKRIEIKLTKNKVLATEFLWKTESEKLSRNFLCLLPVNFEPYTIQ